MAPRASACMDRPLRICKAAGDMLRFYEVPLVTGRGEPLTACEDGSPVFTLGHRYIQAGDEVA
eukprot:SAG22_NODE_15885_length_338_cov_0.640167_1_plen_62_part_10